MATFNGGSDQLFSIETLTWEATNDSVTAGPGVRLLEKPVELDLKGNSGGRGDQLGMSDGNTPLLVNVVSGIDDIGAGRSQRRPRRRLLGNIGRVVYRLDGRTTAFMPAAH